eukprot:TRINITY_DN9700_c1_g1_i1.p1 TRINITY_DN9700_c1_g1~~TRINITY_DN9700_c1_g1_i1.p1  ORF type:complete len:891 (-),score=128.40 TRINITY_DN9700_c1_g1_i1:74-2746(-)
MADRPWDSIYWLERTGYRLNDRTFQAAYQRHHETGDSEHIEASTCIACRKRWAVDLLWPGRLEMWASPEEARVLSESLDHNFVLLEPVVVGGRFLSDGTKLLQSAGKRPEGFYDVVPGSLKVMLPSCCPPCHRLIQRRGVVLAQQPPFAVIVRGPPEETQFFSMRLTLSSYYSLLAAPTEEVQLNLGQGRKAIRCVLGASTNQELEHALRLAVPGCCIDYLPPLPEQGPFRVAVAELGPGSRRGRRLSLSASQVGDWLELAGLCKVSACFEDEDSTSILAELVDADSWHRALALNGEFCAGQLVLVSAWVENRRDSNDFLAMTSMTSFLAKARAAHVPSDVPSIAQAVAAGFQRIIVAAGTYDLPDGLDLQNQQIVGEGTVQITLGSPIVVRSDMGASLQNLRISAHAASSVRALLCVHSSYKVAVGKAHAKYSDMTPAGPLVAVACCTAGTPAVVVERCTFQGGHHAIDIRGNHGLRSRAGVNKRSSFASVDLAAWLERCRQALAVPEDADGSGVSLEILSTGVCNHWTFHKQTSVRLLDCELCSCEKEAVNVWRGADLHMDRCRIRDCAQGVSISRSCVWQELKQFHHFRTPSQIDVSHCTFDDLIQHPWSCALSLDGGVFVAADSQPETIHVNFEQNVIRRCNVALSANGCRLCARQNELQELLLGGVQLCDVEASLSENVIKGCLGVALAISAKESKSPWCSYSLKGNLIQSCEVGVRLSSTGNAACRLQMSHDSLKDNGDGVVLCSGACVAELTSCELGGSMRCAVHVGSGAKAKLADCALRRNGRGVAVAAEAAAEVRGCLFDSNTGWALRLEGPPRTGENAPEHRSLLCGNLFSSDSKRGQRRMRFDPWHDDLAETVDNKEIGTDGAEVLPVRKFRRKSEDAD